MGTYSCVCVFVCVCVVLGGSTGHTNQPARISAIKTNDQRGSPNAGGQVAAGQNVDRALAGAL